MTLLGWVLAALCGVATGFISLFMLLWAASMFSGELGDTPNNVRRGNWWWRSFIAFLALSGVAAIGLIVGLIVNALPTGWGWLAFAGIALASGVVTLAALLGWYSVAADWKSRYSNDPPD